jgi:hypothetical protein
MKANPDFPPLCESFFAKRLIAQRKASQHTISSYAHIFAIERADGRVYLTVFP